MKLSQKIELINKEIMFLNLDKLPIGLFSGKMGLCIYYYYCAKQTLNEHYLKFADNLLQNICQNINQIKSIHVNNGLAGIGLGIHFLLKNNFLNGVSSSILKNIDNEIFRKLSYAKYNKDIDTASLIQLLYYLCLKLNDQKITDEKKWLYQELIIYLINELYLKYDFKSEIPLLMFDLNYQLPQIIFVLGQIYDMNFYNNRVAKILEEISVILYSIIPILDSNKLYLLWGMMNIKSKLDIEGWQEYIQKLKKSINIRNIFESELRNKNIFFNNGLSGVYFILSELSQLFTEKQIHSFSKMIIEKMEQSEVWDVFLKEKLFLEKECGLYSGFCGASIVWNHLIKKYHED